MQFHHMPNMSTVAVFSLFVGHLCTCESTDLWNVALGKRALQSDTHYDRSADNAVDGGVSQIFSDRSCSQTSTGTNAFWEVDLGRTYSIDHVTIYNREDCCVARLRDVKLLIGKADANYTLHGYHEGIIESIYTFQLKPAVRGRWVRITRNSSISDPLNICEVEVFGKPYERYQKGTGTVIETWKTRSLTMCGYICLITYECEVSNFLEEVHQCELLSSNTTESAAPDTTVLI